MSYKLQLEIFEGPLDLLLYLIKKNDIDVCDIPIAEVTEQYMQYIEMMKMLDLEIVGEFLVMAATLMQIKSKMLLPPDPAKEEQGEDDPRDELIKRLQEYKIFKEVADALKLREQEKQNLFKRHFDKTLTNELIEENKEVYFEASLFDLINALNEALNKFKDPTIYSITEDEFTVEEKIHVVLHLLLERPRIVLTEIFSRANSKQEIIVTFIAVLELIRLKEVVIMQKRLFADIEMMRNKNNIIPLSNSDDAEFSDDNAAEIDSETGRCRSPR